MTEERPSGQITRIDVLALLITFGFPYLIFHSMGLIDPFYSWIKMWSTVVTGLLSGLFSLALVVLYYRQKEIIKQQADTQEEQKELMEAELLPRLEVDSYSGDDDGIRLSLANIGNGSAYSISAKLNLQPLEPESGDYRMPEYPNRESLFGPLECMDDGLGNHLEQREKQEFRGDVLLPDVYSLNGTYMSPNVYFERLSDRGIDEVLYQIVISYDHDVSNKPRGYYYLPLRQVTISSDMRLSELFDNRSAVYVGDKAVFSEETGFKRQGTYYLEGLE